MTDKEFRKHLEGLVNTITFGYNGYDCGIDPLAVDEYVMWCGDDSITVKNVDDVMSMKFFNGQAFSDILNDLSYLDY